MHLQSFLVSGDLVANSFMPLFFNRARHVGTECVDLNKGERLLLKADERT